jgi:arginine/ornithine N-succinyltransferase beta subunit
MFDIVTCNGASLNFLLLGVLFLARYTSLYWSQEFLEHLKYSDCSGRSVVWEMFVKHLFLHWFTVDCAETYICV